MTEKPKPPLHRDDPEQSKRFIEAAIEAGEAAPSEFERAFNTVIQSRSAPSLSDRQKQVSGRRRQKRKTATKPTGAQ
jgi:hypothetical protein